MLFVTCELRYITGRKNNTCVDCHNNDVIFKKIPTRVQNKIFCKTYISGFLDLEN